MNGSGALLTRLGGVDLLSWNPLRTSESEAGPRLVNNFGDLLGPLLVERITGAHLRTSTVEPSTAPVLVTVGSILHYAPEGAVIWGTGVNFKLASKLPLRAESLDIRAVRGPHSARALTAAGRSVPAVFGDPGLLLPRFMPEMTEWREVGEGGVVVVPNLNDFDSMARSARARGWRVVDPRGPLPGVLRAIAGGDLVVGSSLHAVVVADALGVPARLVASDSEGAMKYRDYLAGTGRPFTRIAPDVESAVALGGHDRAQVDEEALLDAFPRELWTRARARSVAPEFTDRPVVIAAWRELLHSALPDTEPQTRQFVDEIFPRVIEAGHAWLDAERGDSVAAREDGFSELFADAHAYRLAFVPEIDDSQLDADGLVLLEALDGGHDDQFLRRLWLEREGPHALLRAIAVSHGVHVFSVALRPGSLANTLSEVEIIVEQEDGLMNTVTVPVFEMYHRQWSIDLCATIDYDAEKQITGAYVRLIEDDGAERTLPVLQAPEGSASLLSYPDVTGLPRWSESTTRPVGEATLA